MNHVSVIGVYVFEGGYITCISHQNQREGLRENTNDCDNFRMCHCLINCHPPNKRNQTETSLVQMRGLGDLCLNYIPSSTSPLERFSGVSIVIHPLYLRNYGYITHLAVITHDSSYSKRAERETLGRVL